jgi:hypothetical protein
LAWRRRDSFEFPITKGFENPHMDSANGQGARKRLINMKYRRMLTGIVLLCILTASLEAGFFVLLHAGHEHTGEACPICAQAKDAADALRRLLDGLLKPAGLVEQASLLLSVSIFLLRFSDNIKHQTLITAKVRLND